MRRHTLLPLVAGLSLVHAVVTPALAGSAKALLTVGARVVANCRVHNGGPVCTKGTTAPKTDTVSSMASEVGVNDTVIVTVNY